MVSTMDKKLNIQEIVKKSIDRQLSEAGINEAVVAEPKKYKQASEMVSQRTRDAHYDLYKGYTETFNLVSAELDSADRTKANSSHSSFRSLKLDEAYNQNAMWLHELYFANCFDPSSEIYMDSHAYMRLQRDFGDFEKWQKDFMACGVSAGEGWVVCGYNMFTRKFVNTIVSHHSGDVQMGLYPVIVVDMWSHAYNRDYLNDKKSYLTAMMRELNWNTIEERFERVIRLEGALK